MKRQWTRYVWMTILICVLVIPPTHVLAQQTNIKLWTFIDPQGSGVRSQALQHLIQSFEQGNPGIKVAPQVVKWNEISPSLLRAVSTHTGVPDLAVLYAPDIPLQMAAKTLTPLNRFMANWNVSERADFVIPLSQTSENGNVYGIYYEVRIGMMVYRKDLFDQYNLKIPRTMTELTQVAKVLKDHGSIGFIMDFNPNDAYGTVIDWFVPVLGSIGEKIVNPDGTAAFNNEKVAHVVQWIYDAVNKDGITPPDIALMGDEDTERLFDSGRGGIMITIFSRLEAIRHDSGLGAKIQWMPYPSFDNPAKPAPAHPVGWAMVIPAGAAQPDLAWRLIERWISPEIQVDQAKTAGYMPSRKSVLKDPWFSTEEARDVRRAVEYASANPMKNFQWPAHTEVLYDTWAQMFGQILTNRLSVAQGLGWAAKEYNSKIQAKR